MSEDKLGTRLLLLAEHNMAGACDALQALGWMDDSEGVAALNRQAIALARRVGALHDRRQYLAERAA